ncbi:MFS transporter [Amycolatopsis australiensis]|uniref:MFS transporter n=1 Tax=Amycolatopsis australiensis TaxID=546364 RepID=UPI0009319855|nr:MFS transporter [Amycolatopsis australiensis]
MGALEQTTSKADSLRIFGAAGISLLGDGVRSVALPLLAVALSPTPAAVGIVTFAGTVPILLFTLLGGALADRQTAGPLCGGPTCCAVPSSRRSPSGCS